jgi:hypothetical protein
MGLVGAFVVMCVFIVGADREPPLITPQHHSNGRFTNRPYESVEMPQCMPLGFTNSGNAMGLVGAFVVMCVFIVGAAREPPLITPQHHFHGRFTNRPYESGEMLPSAIYIPHRHPRSARIYGNDVRIWVGMQVKWRSIFTVQNTTTTGNHE